MSNIVKNKINRVKELFVPEIILPKRPPKMVILGPRSEAELHALLKNCYAFHRKLGEISAQNVYGKNQDYVMECSNWYKEFADMLFLALVSDGFSLDSLNDVEKNHDLHWVGPEDLQRPLTEDTILQVIDSGHAKAIVDLKAILTQYRLPKNSALVLSKGVEGISGLIGGGNHSPDED